MDPRFARVKARYLLPSFIVTAILSMLGIGAAGLSSSLDSKYADGVIVQAGMAWLWYLLLLAITIVYAGRAGVGVGSSFGACPGPAQAARIAVIGIPLVASSTIIAYIVFAPLSLLWPEAIQSWLFDYVPAFYSAEEPYPAAANLLGLSALVIAAPVTEEWFFRGLLLRRLTLKWGTVSGVVGSSLIFGLMHADIVGATVFGIVMCALYARSGSLWAPTIAHAANNAIAGGFTALGAHAAVDLDALTIEELRAYWVAPLIALAIAGPWVYRVWAAWRPMHQWRFGASYLPEAAISALQESGAANVIEARKLS